MATLSVFFSIFDHSAPPGASTRDEGNVGLTTEESHSGLSLLIPHSHSRLSHLRPPRSLSLRCNRSEQAAKSALVFRSQSHSTLHQLAAAAEDSNHPPTSFEALRSGVGPHAAAAGTPHLSRPTSSLQLSSLGLGGVGGGGGESEGTACCGGSTSAVAASEPTSTPEVSLHHNDPIYSRHRATHGSRHEMSLQVFPPSLHY